MNLVVADDERIVRHGISTACKQSVPGLQVREARNGHEVIQMMNETNIDILFVDIRMPKIGGLQLLEELQSRKSGTVTVIVSGYEDFSYAQIALRYGVLDYLLKPAGFTQIRDALSRALEVVEARKMTAVAMKLSDLSERSSGQAMMSPLQKACNYIDANCHKKISLADAAREAHVAATHLATLFKQQLGQTFLEYVTASKMQAGCSLLVKGFNVQEVAERLGYEDAKYFGQLFYKHLGVKPREYRARLLQHESE